MRFKAFQASVKLAIRASRHRTYPALDFCKETGYEAPYTEWNLPFDMMEKEFELSLIAYPYTDCPDYLKMMNEYAAQIVEYNPELAHVTGDPWDLLMGTMAKFCVQDIEYYCNEWLPAISQGFAYREKLIAPQRMLERYIGRNLYWIGSPYTLDCIMESYKGKTK